MTMNNDSYQFFAKSLPRLMTRYEGQCVAIVGKSVVAHGKDGKIVYEKAQKKFPDQRVLVAQALRIIYEQGIQVK
jgi:hypothetical protein